MLKPAADMGRPASALDGFLGAVRLSVLADGLFRVQVGPDFDERPSMQVVSPRPGPLPWAHAGAEGGALRSRSASAQLSIRASDSGLIVELSCPAAASSPVPFTLPVGGRGGLDRLTLQTLPPVPVSSAGYYVLDDSLTTRLRPSGADGSAIPWWEWSRNATDIYFLCYGSASAADFERGSAQLALLTGAPPLMPRAAYGVWYSGCCIDALYSQQAVERDILAEYNARDLPLHVLVLDYFWHKPGWCSYSWDRKRFPNPQALRDGLRSGANAYGAPLSLVSNIHPGCVISRQSEERYDQFALAYGTAPDANRSFECSVYDVR
jgi:hypothetical protein